MNECLVSRQANGGTTLPQMPPTGPAIKRPEVRLTMDRGVCRSRAQLEHPLHLFSLTQPSTLLLQAIQLTNGLLT